MYHPSRVSSAKIVSAFLAVALLALAGCGSPEDRAQKYFERGKELFESGDLVKSRIELRNALQIKPDLVAAWRILAQIEERNRNYDALLATSRRIAELDPKDVDARLRFSRIAFFAGALDEALKMITSAIDVEPRNTAALALRAGIMLRLNDRNGAVQEAHKVLGIDSANVDAMIVLAAERFANDDTKAALRILEDIPAARQDDMGVLLMKVKVYEKAKDLPKVEANMRKLMELNPQNPMFRRELLRFYVANQRQDEAEKELRATVAANPTDTNLGMTLVRFVLSLKGPAVARVELAERIKAGGRTFPYEMALAELDLAQGKSAEGISSLERLIAKPGSSPEDVLAARTRLAQYHMGRKSWASAEGLISDILNADSRNIGGLRLRAALRIERGQLEDAMTDLRQALNDQPRSADLLLLMANALERNGQIDLADKNNADALRASNFNPNVGLAYVAFLQRRGLAQHSENVLSELASRNPGNARVLSALAQAKLARQDWAGAHEIAETLRKLGNQGTAADQIAAAAFGGEQKFDQSIDALESVRAANPDSIQPMFAMVRTYVQANQVDKAEALLDSVLKVNPKNSEALVLRGFTKLVRNAPDDARKSFNMAIEQDPKKPAGYAAMADFYVRQKNLDDAVAILRKGLVEIPGNSSLRMAVAGILELKGDYDAAITEYDALHAEQQGSLVVANNLASLLSEHRTDKASLDRAHAIAVVLNKSQVPQFKDTLGWINHLRGDHRAAIPLLEEAAAALPNHPVIRYHLGAGYKAAGDTARGMEELKKADQMVANDSELKRKIRAAMN